MFTMTIRRIQRMHMHTHDMAFFGSVPIFTLVELNFSLDLDYDESPKREENHATHLCRKVLCVCKFQSRRCVSHAYHNGLIVIASSQSTMEPGHVERHYSSDHQNAAHVIRIRFIVTANGLLNSHWHIRRKSTQCIACTQRSSNTFFPIEAERPFLLAIMVQRHAISLTYTFLVNSHAYNFLYLHLLTLSLFRSFFWFSLSSSIALFSSICHHLYCDQCRHSSPYYQYTILNTVCPLQWMWTQCFCCARLLLYHVRLDCSQYFG